jgi:hypothetical protein
MCNGNNPQGRVPNNVWNVIRKDLQVQSSVTTGSKSARLWMISKPEDGLLNFQFETATEVRLLLFEYEMSLRNSTRASSTNLIFMT